MSDRVSLILSSAYFPPVQYFAEILRAGTIIIENSESYSKQNYRNRCNIYSANGILPLSVPVERGSFHKVDIKYLKIDYSRKWQKNHIRAIKSAYNSSAFYEFYSDEIKALIESGHKYLVDLNSTILDSMLSLLEIDTALGFSKIFKKEYGAGCRDMREEITPKKPIDIKAAEYFQVFSPKHGFIPNLSILDLLFNMGPESVSYLRNFLPAKT